jgi:hypothetical protein
MVRMMLVALLEIGLTRMVAQPLMAGWIQMLKILLTVGWMKKNRLILLMDGLIIQLRIWYRIG